MEATVDPEFNRFKKPPNSNSTTLSSMPQKNKPGTGRKKPKHYKEIDYINIRWQLGTMSNRIKSGSIQLDPNSWEKCQVLKAFLKQSRRLLYVLGKNIPEHFKGNHQKGTCPQSPEVAKFKIGNLEHALPPSETPWGGRCLWGKAALQITPSFAMYSLGPTAFHYFCSTSRSI